MNTLDPLNVTQWGKIRSALRGQHIQLVKAALEELSDMGFPPNALAAR